MTNFTPEMIEKAKAAKSAEELLALAKENNIELTAEEAKTYFDQLNPKICELSDNELDNVAGGVTLLLRSESGELDDDELDNVSGGGCGDSKEQRYLLDYGKRKCDCGCNEFYKRGSSTRPYWICCDCEKVCYDPFQYFGHEA